MTKRWGGSVPLAVGVVVGVLAMAGCTGEPGPIVTHDVTSTWTPPAVESPTPSPTPSPSATALSDEELLAALPQEAKCNQIYCAKATAEFFIQERNRVLATGDLRVWNALSLESCDYCASVRDNTTAIYASGHYVESGLTTIDEASWDYSLDTDTGDAYAAAVVTTPVRSEFAADGSLVNSAASESGTQSFQLKYVDGFWRVAAAGWLPAP